MGVTARAREMVIRLIEEGKLSPMEISELLGSRVSSRTIYRWAKGESFPQNMSDFTALEDLVRNRLDKPKMEVSA
jgi:hypothetical protein